MSSQNLPPVPQTGIPPLDLPPDQEQRLLSRRRKADQTDPFASDANEEIRRLGRLALRRDVQHPYDYLALGDLCAEQSLIEDERRIRMSYVGKTLYAYRRAADLAARNGHPGERNVAREATEAYVRWLVRVARAAPNRRNIAVALWAVAEAEQDGPLQSLRDEAQLLALWYVAPPQTDDLTPAPDATPAPPSDEIDMTQLDPEAIATRAYDSHEVASEILSMADGAAELSETRSDKSEVFRVEIEPT